MTKNLVLTAALLAATATVATAQTFCNPIDLPYRYALDGGYREAADPTLINYHGTYYLFASKCGAYFSSTDLKTWVPIASNLPIEGYAPTVEEMEGRLYFTHSVGTSSIYTTTEPSTGKWEKVAGGGKPGDVADPMLLFTQGKMYIYWGSSGDPSSWLCGQQLDTATLKPTDDEAQLMRCNKDSYGWEVPGDYNQQKDGNPWLEGVWVTEHGGTYYLQYSAPGTEAKAYCDAVYTAPSALGPYTVARHNPFCYRPEGFIASSGHGSTVQDNHGNYWHIATGTISKRHMFERRLVMYPVFFDPDGTMWAYTGFGDWPMRLPQKKISSPEELETGWVLLSYKKAAKASSASTGHAARLAVNEDIRSWWAAKTGDEGEWLRVDLGAPCDIHAVQVNLADEGSTIKGATADAYRYRLEVSDDDATWTVMGDYSDATSDAPHRYVELPQAVKARYVRIYNVHTPSGRFSVSGLRVFGLNAATAKPAQAQGLIVSRDPQDARTVNLAWDKAKGATGYNVRYGYAPDKLYLNYQAGAATSLTINSLNADEPTYYFTIDTYNDGGITRGTEVVSSGGRPTARPAARGLYIKDEKKISATRR